jgi:hypothetical protein
MKNKEIKSDLGDENVFQYDPETEIKIVNGKIKSPIEKKKFECQNHRAKPCRFDY